MLLAHGCLIIWILCADWHAARHTYTTSNTQYKISEYIYDKTYSVLYRTSLGLALALNWPELAATPRFEESRFVAEGGKLPSCWDPMTRPRLRLHAIHPPGHWRRPDRRLCFWDSRLRRRTLGRRRFHIITIYGTEQCSLTPWLLIHGEPPRASAIAALRRVLYKHSIGGCQADQQDKPSDPSSPSTSELS